MGRPEIQIDPAEVERLASRGLTEDQIARCLGVHYNTLLERKKKYVEFSDAVKNGKASGLKTIANALFEKAHGGDTTAMIFYLKNRDPQRWLEPEREEMRTVLPVINVTVEK